jgi:hypothetical protein
MDEVQKNDLEWWFYYAGNVEKIGLITPPNLRICMSSCKWGKEPFLFTVYFISHK